MWGIGLLVLVLVVVLVVLVVVELVAVGGCRWVGGRVVSGVAGSVSAHLWHF